MTLFEFIMGMVSVILALAVAQLFSGVAMLVQSHGRVKTYLPHGIWIVSLFLLTFLHWWSLWAFRDLSWNFGMFFFSLLGPSLMFFACTLINRRNLSKPEIDLMAHFFDIRRLFMGVVIAMFLLFTFDGPLFGTEPLLNSLRVVQLVLSMGAFWGFVSESRAVHTAVSLTIFATTLAILVFRFFPN